MKSKVTGKSDSHKSRWISMSERVSNQLGKARCCEGKAGCCEGKAGCCQGKSTVLKKKLAIVKEKPAVVKDKCKTEKNSKALDNPKESDKAADVIESDKHKSDVVKPSNVVAYKAINVVADKVDVVKESVLAVAKNKPARDELHKDKVLDVVSKDKPKGNASSVVDKALNVVLKDKPKGNASSELPKKKVKTDIPKDMHKFVIESQKRKIKAEVKIKRNGGLDSDSDSVDKEDHSKKKPEEDHNKKKQKNILFLEDLLMKASLVYPHDGMFVKLYEKYFQLFKEQMSLNDDADMNGDDDVGGDGDGDGDDDGNGDDDDRVIAIDGNEDDAGNRDDDGNGDDDVGGDGDRNGDDASNADDDGNGDDVDGNDHADGNLNRDDYDGGCKSIEKQVDAMTKENGEALDAIDEDMRRNNEGTVTPKSETVFETTFGEEKIIGIRLNMKTLSPGLWIDANVVDCWGDILNYEDRFRKDGYLSRHFFRTGCITMSMFVWTLSTYEDKWKSFAAEVSAQFKDNVGGLALSGIDLFINLSVLDVGSVLIVQRSMFSSMFRSDDLDDGDDRHWLYIFSVEVVYDGDEAVVVICYGDEAVVVFGMIFVKEKSSGGFRRGFEKDNELELDTEDVLHEFANPNAVIEEVTAMERQMYRQEALDFKTIEATPKCETKLPIELHAARVYTRMIFLLVQTEIIQDGRRMGTYVEKLKILLEEVKADMPNPALRNTGDVIGGIFSISKPNQVDVKKSNKGCKQRRTCKKGERLKNEREKAIKVKAKAMNVCGYCQEKTNEHTKITCPKNPKTRKKKKVTPIIDV
nr:ulp1 protease family, C-terminal catalytic domain-containing protein [Tanacetum cinerariifolium]